MTKSAVPQKLKTGQYKTAVSTSEVSEAAVLYERAPNNFSILKHRTPKPEFQLTAVEKMEMMREGISKEGLEHLKARTSLDYDKLSTLLATTRATLINKKGKEQFSPALGERIISIAEIYSYGYSVFEDVKKFRSWVFRPNQALGGKQPFELLDNQFGREEVKNLIGRIDYGVYS